MKVITIAGRKGGVGKTSTAYTIATWAANSGKSVLAIDLDPQANLSAALDLDLAGTSTDQWLLDNAAPQETRLGITATAGGTDLTSGRMASIWPTTLAQRLDGALWDLVVCDCPPGIAALEHLAVAAASKVLICTDDHPFGVSGAIALLGEIQRQTAFSPETAIIRSRVNAQTKRAREASAGLADIGVPVFQVRIDEALANATISCQPLSPTTRSGIDMTAINDWAMA